MHQRAFTLIEVAVVAGIAAVLLSVAIPLAAGSRAAGSATAALQLDATVARAQSLASTSGNGSTVQFLAARGGFETIVYSGRPNGAGMSQSGAPEIENANVREQSLGKPPFTVYFDSTGHASAASGIVDTSSSIAADPGCPSEGSVAIVVSDARERVFRSLACAQ